jgi:hypothetical protein
LHLQAIITSLSQNDRGAASHLAAAIRLPRKLSRPSPSPLLFARDHALNLQVEACAMERAPNATIYSPELPTMHYGSRHFKARAPSRIPSIPRSYALCASASLSQQIDHNPTTKGAEEA